MIYIADSHIILLAFIGFPLLVLLLFLLKLNTKDKDE